MRSLQGFLFLIVESAQSNPAKGGRHRETVHFFMPFLLFLQEDVINTQCGYDVRRKRVRIQIYTSTSPHTSRAAFARLSLELLLSQPASEDSSFLPYSPD